MKKHYLPNWFVRTVSLVGLFAAGHSLDHSITLCVVETIICVYLYWSSK